MANKSEMPAKAEDLSWRRFPTIEGLFAADLEGFLRRAEKTCRQIDKLADSENPREAARARAALASYGKALELIQEIRGTLAEQDN